MGENSKAADAPKKSWWTGLKAEFKRVIWPDKKSVGKQTFAVVVITILLCALITLIDAVIHYGLGFIL